MIDWWVALILGFTGGFVGGTLAYHMEANRAARLRLYRRPHGSDTDPTPRDDGGEH